MTAAGASASWHKIYLNRSTIGYWSIHVAALAGVIYTGASWRGLGLALLLYVPRMFFVTAAYHRYFSHRSFKTSRWFQFLLGLGATLTGQKGPLWWASHHRTHHKHSDSPRDVHSAVQDGFWWAHHGWITAGRDITDYDRIKDFAKYPELVWLNRFWVIPMVALAVLTLALGGVWGLVWGFFVCQVLIWHGTFTINSLSHLWGTRRYPTGDDSRNNAVLAVITMGEGWHNNHHHYQVSARQGFFWWELDVTYYVLRALAVVGLIWDIHGVPEHVRRETQLPRARVADMA